MAKAKLIPDLSAEENYGEAAAKVIATRTGELREQARGVLDTGDIERVHDMRVATRRLRAALEVFEQCFERKPYRRALREVKRLADELGERRDRDVAISSLRGFNEQMPAADRRGVESLIATLRDEQAEANLALAPLVDEANLDSLAETVNELLAGTRGRSGGAAATNGGSAGDGGGPG